ncbi:hypothetical protein BC832DRAFT_563442 [Gaertneriomyces semiglobifer]|nr:hypothetical protein BC832DRAFT_563442 [Gaertneriomyces semiglobifer]
MAASVPPAQAFRRGRRSFWQFSAGKCVIYLLGQEKHRMDEAGTNVLNPFTFIPKPSAYLLFLFLCGVNIPRQVRSPTTPGTASCTGMHSGALFACIPSSASPHASNGDNPARLGVTSKSCDRCGMKHAALMRCGLLTVQLIGRTVSAPGRFILPGRQVYFRAFKLGLSFSEQQGKKGTYDTSVVFRCEYHWRLEVVTDQQVSVCDRKP